MTTPKILEIDVQTGAEVLRDFNADEMAQHAIDLAENEAKQAEELAASNAKKEAAAKLVALGIDPKALGIDIEVPIA